MSIVINMLKSCDLELIALGARIALFSGPDFCKKNLSYKKINYPQIDNTENRIVHYNDKCIIYTKHSHMYKYKGNYIICNGIIIFFIEGNEYAHNLLNSFMQIEQQIMNKGIVQMLVSLDKEMVMAYEMLFFSDINRTTKIIDNDSITKKYTYETKL